MKAYTVCPKAEASIFWVLWPDKSEQVVESKDFRRQNKECMAVFFSMCEKCYRKSCKYMRNTSTRHKGKKTLQIPNIKVSSTTVWKYMTSKGWKALPWREKGGAHADMMSEGFGNFIAKGDRLANSRDVNPLETIWIIVDEDKEPKNTKNQPPNNWTS